MDVTLRFVCFFTIRPLQQADVIQLADGGEGLGAAQQLTAKVEVTHPVPVHTKTCFYTVSNWSFN